MTACSIKNLWRISWLFGFLTSTAHAAADYEAFYRLELNSRLAYHLFAPQDLASHRHTLDLEQRVKSGPWAAVLAAQVLAETAYASNPRYDQVARSSSQELSARDIYLQYKDPNWLIRAGNQQVIWGEAFGFYFADIVNPKDRRDFGLGELSRQRIPVPMLQLKHLFGKSSAQLIYIPKPYFNKEPYTGSDFGNVYRDLFPEGKVNVSDERSLPLVDQNGEAGFRATTMIRGVDLSAFYFYYHDRMPNYRLSVTNPSPLELNLDGYHSRIHTGGITATTEIAPFVFRMEGLHTVDRQFDSVRDGTYSAARSGETTAVLGVDYTKIANWRLGMQLSDTYLTENIPGSLTPKNRPLLTWLLSGPIYREQTLEVILSYVANDGSSLAQIRYLTPLSSQIELLFGADILMGGSQSQFGRFKSASRGYVLLKGYLLGS